jgi:hypothetical protein
MDVLAGIIANVDSMCDDDACKSKQYVLMNY